MRHSLFVLPTQIGSVRSVRFTPDGYLIVAEDADYVTIYDPHFESSQVIDFFGEISGVSVSPDGSMLFIGNADETYGSILQFTRSRYSWICKEPAEENDLW
jgi:WD40 repeat protein